VPGNDLVERGSPPGELSRVGIETPRDGKAVLRTEVVGPFGPSFTEDWLLPWESLLSLL
jgi:hypothetical protein